MPEDIMLKEAIEALRTNDRTRAKDLLTRLLKTDQNNPTYWIWLSATVDTPKERIYCLQTVLKLDPGNATAKRGLILLGALPPDDSIPPFPLNHPRLWEEKLTVVEDSAKPKGLKAIWANPVGRLIFLLVIAGLVVTGVYLGFVAPNVASPARRTAGPIGTYPPSSTPRMTNTPVVRTTTPTFIGPTPLWMMLPATYTPTPLYVVTEHSPASADIYRSAMGAFKKGQWENAIDLFQQLATVEPSSADAYYYIGESYLRLEDYTNALAAFDQAIAVDRNFAPGYYGRAITRRMISGNAPTLDDLDKAISLDPEFPLPYLERGIYWLNNESPNTALEDLETALELMPDSALVYYNIAQAHLANGDFEEALVAAEKANQLDITMLPVYSMLGKIYYENGQYEEAFGALQTYNLYVEDDPDVPYMLGAIYNQQGKYAESLQALNSAVELGNKTAPVYYQRGIAYLNLSELDLAEKDFNRSLGLGRINHDYYPALGLAWVEYAKEKYGNTYVQVQQQVRPLATTDARLAETNYWAARALEGMDRHDLAIRYWNEMLALPDEVIKEEWRAEALQYLGTPTP